MLFVLPDPALTPLWTFALSPQHRPGVLCGRIGLEYPMSTLSSPIIAVLNRQHARRYDLTVLSVTHATYA